MAWKIKGRRAYEYRSVRRNGRVVSRYIGEGSISAESGRLFNQLEAGRRAERMLARLDWWSKRLNLEAAEREFIEADTVYAVLGDSAMLAAGFHRQSRGRWRRRRRMATELQNNPDRPQLMGEAEMNELLDRIDRTEGDEKQALRVHAFEGLKILQKYAELGLEEALPALRVAIARRPHFFRVTTIGEQAIKAHALAAGGGKDVLGRELYAQQIASMRDELAGPTASPLERMLAERVALTWFDSLAKDIVAVQTTSEGVSLAKADFLQRQADRANSRFLASCKALATVRRLAVPALQLNIAARFNPGQVSFKSALDQIEGSRSEQS